MAWHVLGVGVNANLPTPSPEQPLEIVTAQVYVARNLEVPPSFALRFPAHWRPVRLQNPLAEVIERETLEWLRAHGIGVDSDEAAKLRGFECAKYGGYSLPTAGHAEALLVTEFISLWLFWDDMQVEEEQAWDIEAVVRALTRAGSSTEGSRYLAAWSDIGGRLRRTQSAAWLDNLASTMRQWLYNAKVETGMARSFKRGRCPDLATAFACRTISIGMYPTFHLLEYAENLELPARVHRHPTVVELKRLASRLVGVGNDLGGLAKDLQTGWLNLVSILRVQAQLTTVEAFQRVVDIHNADVSAFDRLAAQLPSWGPNVDPRVARWLRSVRHNVHGFTLWEATAERYQSLKAIVDGTPLIAPVGAYDPARRVA